MEDRSRSTEGLRALAETQALLLQHGLETAAGRMDYLAEQTPREGVELDPKSVRLAGQFFLQAPDLETHRITFAQSGEVAAYWQVPSQTHRGYADLGLIFLPEGTAQIAASTDALLPEGTPQMGSKLSIQEAAEAIRAVLLGQNPDRDPD